MPTRLGLRLAGIATRGHVPRWTVRLRLTLLYGVLFLASGALMLAITYGLVDRATQDDPVTITLTDGATVTAGASGDVSDPAASATDQLSSAAGSTPAALPSPEEVKEMASQQHASRMHELLVQSGIALGVMAVVSVALGWVVAGRVLRPLRTIVAAARGISAANLHRRLALDGPDDELKELGDTFDDLLDRLERAFDAQRRFVANASHELRTPLARQRTVAQVALDDRDATVESLRAAHQRVLVAGAQQERLIDALLSLARGQTGSDRREPLDLAELTSDLLAARRAEAQRRNLRLQEALTAAPTTGDPRLVENLIGNLVDNALCHNEEDGTVDVVTGTRDGHAVLSVANTGPVVPAADVDRLFEPFERLDTNRRSHDGGLGLGLSIVQAIATAHGATIDVDPQPDGGLRVEVFFPAAEAPVAVAWPVADAEPSTAPATPVPRVVAAPARRGANEAPSSATQA
jgi:signal transduction histidine kinase